MVPMNSRTFNCDRFMANLFTTEWAHDHVETQLQLPISIPVVWHLRDVFFLALAASPRAESVKKLSGRKNLIFCEDFLEFCSALFKSYFLSLLTDGWNRSVSVCRWP